MEMGLYDRIQKLFEDRKISIARLESDCGFSNSTIKKWKATSTPGVDKICLLYTSSEPTRPY